MMERSEILNKITLHHLKDTPNWKDLSDDELVDLVREILIRFDIHLQHLGVELMHLGQQDPDANYTPCEHQMHVMAKLFGIDYSSEVNDEAYARIQEWDRHLAEVRKKRGADE